MSTLKYLVLTLSVIVVIAFAVMDGRFTRKDISVEVFEDRNKLMLVAKFPKKDAKIVQAYLKAELQSERSD